MSHLDNIILTDEKTEEDMLLEYCEYVQLEEQMRQAIDQYEQDQMMDFDFPGYDL